MGKKMAEFHKNSANPTAGAGQKNSKDQNKTKKKTMGAYMAKKKGFAGGIID